MRRLGLLCLTIVAGCQRPATPVYVDLNSVPLAETKRPILTELQPGKPPSLPSAAGKLDRLAGAQVTLSETANRVRVAREIIADNKKQALRGLKNALYRSYSRKAEAERNLNIRDLEKAADALWDKALEDISTNLREHGRNRLPLENRLALLVGFPNQDPARQPRSENPVDAKRYDEAVAAWRKLLAEDKEFARLAQSILDQVQDEIDRRQVQIHIDYARALNAADDRSIAEAEAAVASRLPDFVGGLSQRPDVRLNPEPERIVQLPTVPAPSSTYARARSVPLDLSRHFLEHDLQIWLAQNGYVLADRQSAAPDRTREFIAWVNKRRTGP